MNNPQSPVTLSNNTALDETFRSADIIRLYRQQLDIDVSRFFAANNQFYLYRCLDTGYRFYYPKGLDGDGKFYEELQNSLGAGYYHEWKFENQFALESLADGDKILDIGCGEGKFISAIKERTSEAYGLELNKKAVATAVAKGLNVTCQSIQDHAAEREGYYDMATMFQVLEHIHDVNGFINASLKVLKKGGKLVIGVPNSQPWFNAYDKYSTLNLPPHHMGLWNLDVFTKFAAFFNLEMKDYRFDPDGRVLGQAYLRAKYMAGIISISQKHTVVEKIKILCCALITLPLTVIRKFTSGIKGSHIVVLFIKH